MLSRLAHDHRYIGSHSRWCFAEMANLWPGGLSKTKQQNRWNPSLMIFPTKSLSNYKPPSKHDFPKRIYTIFPAIYICILIIYIYYIYNPPEKKNDFPPSHVTLITIVSILPDSSNALNAERLTRPTVSRPNTAMGSSELKPQATTVQVGSDHRILQKSPWPSRLSSLLPWKST